MTSVEDENLQQLFFAVKMLISFVDQMEKKSSSSQKQSKTRKQILNKLFKSSMCTSFADWKSAVFEQGDKEEEEEEGKAKGVGSLEKQLACMQQQIDRIAEGEEEIKSQLGKILTMLEKGEHKPSHSVFVLPPEPRSLPVIHQRGEEDGGRKEGDGGRKEGDGGRKEGDGGRKEEDGGRRERESGARRGAKDVE
eukprot:747380-Hanusia_phi.AAC.1